MSTNSTYQADANLHDAVTNILKTNIDNHSDDSDEEHNHHSHGNDKESLLSPKTKQIHTPKSEDNKKLYHDKFGAVSPLVERSKKKINCGSSYYFYIYDFGIWRWYYCQ